MGASGLMGSFGDLRAVRTELVFVALARVTGLRLFERLVFFAAIFHLLLSG